METESLDAYPFRRSYSTSKDDLLNDFYVPALGHSVRYDRSAGFFSSGLVALAPVAFSHFIQGGGRIRDYDVETGAPVQRWQGDSTQTGRTIDEYGIRLTRQRAADPELRPSVPQYTQQEIEEEALRLSKADPYGDVPMAPEYAEVVESLGYQQPTPERRASVLLSEQVRKGQLSFPKQNINSYPSSILARPVRINFPEETVKSIPTQLSFPSDVVPATAAAARVRVTPADQAAQQLEAYMGRLQRGRTSPLTSQVRIQPSLF